MFANSFGMLLNQIQLDNDSMWADFARSETPEKAFP